jgi:ATP-binding cassette subfamily B protein
MNIVKKIRKKQKIKEVLSDAKALPFFLDCVARFKWLITGQFLFAVVWAIDISLRPYIIKSIIDTISDHQLPNSFQILLLFTGIYILVLTIGVLFTSFNDYIWLKLNSDLKLYIGDRLISKLMLQSHIFYQNRFAGSISNKVNDIIKTVPDLIRILIEKFFGYLLALIIATYTLWKTNPLFGVVFVFWTTIYIILTIKINSKSKELCKETAETRSKVIGYLVDMLNNMTSVQLFNNENFEKEKFSESMKIYINAYQARGWFFIKLFNIQGASFIIYQLFCLYLLVVGFKNKIISPGDFALVLTLNISILDFLKSLSKDINTFSDLGANVVQGLSVINSTIEIKDKPDATPLQVTEGKIVFDKVQFSYKDRELVFKETSIEIKAREKVGLVGYTGGGKSTFANLILRLFDVTSGCILIDGQDIRNVTQESLKKSIGIVPQDAFLFHRSLMENIRYGNIEASDEEVIEAAKCAHAHEFIQSLPSKYDSLVGERGIKLSGGQRQRIAIARAFLKNAPLLILDEATSHLDTVTEGLIQKSFINLMKDKTAIVIAHRLSTLLYMDRILVFNEGKIIDDGTHEKLLKSCNFYERLWREQVKGLIPQSSLKEGNQNIAMVS